MGDGSANELLSESTAGTITIEHTYQAAGVYRVLVEATDKNGNEAFLQLVGQATGAIQSNTKGTNNSVIVETKIIWWPIGVLFVMIFVSFWIGRRYQLRDLQKRLAKSRES